MAVALAALLLGACGAGTPVPAPSSSAPTSASSAASPLPSLPSHGRPVQPTPDVRPQGFAEPPPGRGLDRYRHQQLVWRDCGHGLRCATLLVPLDYAHPDDVAITLTVGMRPASGAARATVFGNPGGPGASGLRFLAGEHVAALADVDLVSWDPRGSGASTPVGCWDDAAMDAYSQLDLSPDSTAERQTLTEEDQRFGLSCLQGSGALLGHVSTAETARDLELIRTALGPDKINFIGLSNGTLIGADYAQLFPDHVGRFVLDGAVDIAHSSTVQLEGFDRALAGMADWCAAQSRCPLGRTRGEVLGTITGLWTRLERQPLTAGGRTLTQTLAAEGVLSGMYDGEQAYPAVIRAVDRAAHADDPHGLLELADQLLSRRSDGTWNQFADAFPASYCADQPNTGLAQAWKESAAEARQAPIFGPVLGTDIQCALWPVNSPPSLGKLTAPRAPALIVIGTTGDPATPYEWAQGMARQLHSAVLVTHRGTGHTAFGSACYPDVVRPFLLDGRLPARGTTC